MEGLPPLSLSSGPAISGGGAYYGGVPSTGAFIYNGRRTMTETIAANLPLVLIVGAALWLAYRK